MSQKRKRFNRIAGPAAPKGQMPAPIPLSRFDASALDRERPVLIAGPTASGKSALALAIAEAGGGTIVNADASQVYEGWQLLTARPGPADLARAPHALYGHVPPEEAYSAGAWLRDAAPLLQGPARCIIVGGTGLYFAALTEGLAEIPPTPPEVRAEADALMAAEGPGAMAATLDPQTHARIDLANPARIQRAWEVQRTTGMGLAAWHARTPPPLLPLSQAQPLLVTAGKDWLNKRIEQRFHAMLDQGLADELRAMQPRWRPDLPAGKAIGAPELMAWLDGRRSLAEATEAAITATRQYAKRQRTWFRKRMAGWPVIDAAA